MERSICKSIVLRQLSPQLRPRRPLRMYLLDGSDQNALLRLQARERKHRLQPSRVLRHYPGTSFYGTRFYVKYPMFDHSKQVLNHGPKSEIQAYDPIYYTNLKRDAHLPDGAELGVDMPFGSTVLILVGRSSHLVFRPCFSGSAKAVISSLYSSASVSVLSAALIVMRANVYIRLI